MLQEEELEYLIKEEVTRKEELRKDLDAEKEQFHKIKMDIEDSKKKLSLVAEQQSELLNRLHIYTLAVPQAETKLGKALAEKTEMLMEMDGLRKQRNAMNRSIEFFQRKRCHKNECRLIEKFWVAKVISSFVYSLKPQPFSISLHSFLWHLFL